MRSLSLWLLLPSAALFTAVFVAVVAVGRADRAGVVEVRISGFGPDATDRCPTCHQVEVGRELPAGHPAVPGYHPVERFGCSPCHGGEGRALDRQWAHQLGREPLFHVSERGETPERLQAGCARCHVVISSAGIAYDPTVVPAVARGHELFVAKGCWGCHRLVDVAFGERGPDLSDAGPRLGGDAIRTSIEYPARAPTTTTMPRLRLSSAEIEDLTVFLMAQVEPGRQAGLATARVIDARRPGRPPRRERVEIGMAAGADVMRRMGCLGCHRLEEGDGRVAPDLRWTADLRGPRYVRDMLTRPSTTVAGSRMPPFDLSASELGACVEYAGRLRASAPASTEEAWRTICARCHGLDGKGRTAVAPHLARRPRDLSDTRFFREVGGPRLARAMADGVPGTPMAPWGRAVAGLSGPRIVTFLAKRLHGGGLPAVRDLEVPARPASLTPRAVSKARMVFDRECSQCHGPGGRGDGPESAGMRPQPRDLTAAVFVSAIDDARLYRSITYGPPGGPMPGHLRGYDPEVMWALVAKVRQLAADPDVRGYGDDVWPWQRHRAQGLAPGRPPAGIATPGAAPGAAGATREAE